MSITEFTSRGLEAPQWEQLCQRSDNSFGASLRQIAQYWDVPAGLTFTTNRPAFAALYGRMLFKNPAIPASAKLLFS